MTPEQARLRAEEERLPEPDIHGIDSMAWSESKVREAIAAALVKLTQGQEPVAQWNWKSGKFKWLVDYKPEWSNAPLDLYTHPIPSQQNNSSTTFKDQS